MASQHSDRVIERGVELWCRMMKRPTFDNGDHTGGSTLAMGLAAVNHANTVSKVDDLDKRIENFRKILVDKLKFLRDHEDEETGRTLYKGHPGEHAERYYFPRHLDCDYGPCPVLFQAAQEAGLPETIFSWKTNINISSDHVSVKQGYGADYMNHYPLPDGRWLVTDIVANGSNDWSKIVTAVLDGKLDIKIES